MEDISRDDFIVKKEEYLSFRQLKFQKDIIKKAAFIQNRTSLNLIEAISEPKEEKSKTNYSQEIDNIVSAINDTSLPSKQPLERNDTFVFLSSKNYMLSFFFISLVLVGIMSLMN